MSIITRCQIPACEQCYSCQAGEAIPSQTVNGSVQRFFEHFQVVLHDRKICHAILHVLN